jgi:hypothetical protein
MKWFATFTFLNFGAFFMDLGLMSRVNECAKHMEDTFFLTGRFMLFLGGILFVISFISSVGNWIIARTPKWGTLSW